MIILTENDTVTTCNDCGCKFIWNMTDVHLMPYGGGYVVSCPKCQLIMPVIFSVKGVIQPDIKGEDQCSETN